jgi:NTE family protein
MSFKPKLGLALGGGGARGGIHIGVLRVLEEARYRPDIVAGASIGAIAAALIGAGWTSARMEELLRQTDFHALVQLDRTGAGLIGTEILETFLLDLFGDADLCDLSPLVAVVAVDIQRRQRILIRRGSVVRALLASTAVPGLLPPVQWGGHLLVDGGVASNVPAQAAYQLGARRLVAVDLSGHLGLGLALDDIGAFNRRLQRALYWLLDLSHRQAAFDTFIQATAYSYDVASEYELTLFPPDVLIRPGADTIGLMGFDRASELIEVGEKAAREALGEIRNLARPRLRRKTHKSADRILPLIELEPDARQAQWGGRVAPKAAGAR